MTRSFKIVYIVSYEAWGKMLMSKHHYAVELAHQGYEVYFINHPDRRHKLKRGEVVVSETDYPNLYSVQHRSVIPYFFKLKYRLIYYRLVKYQIRYLIKRIGKQPDLVWSFDAGNTLPVRFFGKDARKIYMPVDGPFDHIYELDAAEGAHIIVSVTERILTRYNPFNTKKVLVNHGVNAVFLNEVSDRGRSTLIPIRVGYSGSLVRNDLDIGIFKQIIEKHPEIIFEFWGENDPAKSTIHLPQDISEETRKFLLFLRNRSNVILHGAVAPYELAAGLKRMDVLLIAYKIKDDQNHHKVLEYLGTGKVIISSYMSSYAGRTDLIHMVKSQENNFDLPLLFDKVIVELDLHASPEEQHKRIEYAKEFTYTKQVQRVLEQLD